MCYDKGLCNNSIMVSDFPWWSQNHIVRDIANDFHFKILYFCCCLIVKLHKKGKKIRSNSLFNLQKNQSSEFRSSNYLKCTYTIFFMLSIQHLNVENVQLNILHSWTFGYLNWVKNHPEIQFTAWNFILMVLTYLKRKFCYWNHITKPY